MNTLESDQQGRQWQSRSIPKRRKSSHFQILVSTIAAFSLIIIGRKCSLEFKISGESESESENESESGHRRSLATRTRPMKLLYIVTSGGKQYTKDGTSIQSRFQNHVRSVILETVESLTTSTSGKEVSGIPREWMVDVYLVLGYDIEENLFRKELQSIHPNIGLTVWSHAIPLAYACQEWTSREYVNPIGQGHNCFNATGDESSSTEAILHSGKAQLARQHRYVVKELLPHYDFFLAFEDDMIVKRHHVVYHMQWMRKIRTWTNYLKWQEAVFSKDENTTAWTFQNTSFLLPWQQPIPLNQLERLRPGHLRVEVLDGTETQTDTIIDITTNINISTNTNTNTSYTSSAEQIIDPNLCCHRLKYNVKNNSLSMKDLTIHSTDLVIWETGILGFGVRQIPDLNSNMENSWVALMGGPRFEYRPSQYWSGTLLKEPIKRPPSSHPHLIGQSAGWMASQREVMEFHTQFCSGGFLPPFDPPSYEQDGFYKKNVEYWSGGIQLWSGTCSIQRFIRLDKDFSKHLVYHTSNNKQYHTRRQRLVLATTLLAQLQNVQRTAQREAEASST